jgi:hypothetical protein
MFAVVATDARGCGEPQIAGAVAVDVAHSGPGETILDGIVDKARLVVATDTGSRGEPEVTAFVFHDCGHVVVQQAVVGGQR